MKNPTLIDTWPLYKLGFAIHWLRPKSKCPCESKWTKGERKDWNYLVETFIKNLNVGVRTGSPSKIGANYLACIDVDVKDPACRKEAISKLREIVGDKKLPEVRSGSGNGARHLYCVTTKPFKMITVAKYKGWEICIYSDGRQMVLPPSIHPNGASYVWRVPVTATNLALMDFSNLAKSENMKPVKAKGPKVTTKDIHDDIEIDKLLDVRRLPGITSKTRDLIVNGVWNGQKVNRSDYLPMAAERLIRTGLDKNQVLSILTDPTTYLGKCAHDRRPHSRNSAADWLWDYSVKDVFATNDATADFENVINPALQDLDKNSKGKIADTIVNVRLILIHGVSSSVYRWDEFGIADVYGCDTPWGGKMGQETSVHDISLIRHWLENDYKFRANKENIRDAIVKISTDNRFHPVKEYFERLPKWDGKPRVERLFADYFGAYGDKNYLREISRKTICALVRRIKKPGSKFDAMPVFIGKQGTKKSWAVKELVGKKWFTDMPIDPRNKDTVLGMRGKWVIEVAELAGIRGSDTNSLKAFLSREEDRIRVPYRDKHENFPRQFVFMGTANDNEFLKDTTGNRRFWPISVSRTHQEKIARDRDQIWAEALLLEPREKRLDLDDSKILKIAEEEQELRTFQDSWQERLEEFLIKSTRGEKAPFPKKGFSLNDIFGDSGPFVNERDERGNQMRISGILQKLGFIKKRKRNSQGVLAMRYYKPEELGLKVHTSAQNSHTKNEEDCFDFMQ